MLQKYILGHQIACIEQENSIASDLRVKWKVTDRYTKKDLRIPI